MHSAGLKSRRYEQPSCHGWEGHCLNIQANHAGDQILLKAQEFAKKRGFFCNEN
jgi:hypothetical protein